MTVFVIMLVNYEKGTKKIQGIELLEDDQKDPVAIRDDRTKLLKWIEMNYKTEKNQKRKYCYNGKCFDDYRIVELTEE